MQIRVWMYNLYNYYFILPINITALITMVYNILLCRYTYRIRTRPDDVYILHFDNKHYRVGIVKRHFVLFHMYIKVCIEFL